MAGTGAIARRRRLSAKGRDVLKPVLHFAFAPPADAWPSALLRGHQLIELAARTRPGIACRPCALADLSALRGQTVILTKSALCQIRPNDMARLRGCGHRLIADPVDLPPDDDVLAAAHILLASSLTQKFAFRARFPGLSVHYISHHVDLRLPAIMPPTDRARLAYFGKLENCLHADRIQPLVTLIAAEFPADTGWMQHLGTYNAHYALRAATPVDGFKPFTKGFVAARCGAPIIVRADDEEARLHLGPAYPFYVQNISHDAVTARLAQIADSFNTPDWHAALATMRDLATRTALPAIQQQLGAILDAIFC